jgi:N-glycosylase/DNA lyase
MGEQVERALRADKVHGEPPPGAELKRAGRMSLGPVPSGFRLYRTAMSHGWCQLTPTAYDEGRDVLHRTLATPDAGPLTVSVTQLRDGRLQSTWGRAKGSCDDRIVIRAALRRMLALDDDLSELYVACATPWTGRSRRGTPPDLSWVQPAGVGRLLRSPSVFEDLVKTLTTTNCSWALTVLMCRRLVESLGAEGPAGERAFPTPDAMAAAGEAHFSEVVRAGYRSRAFVELATRVRDADIDPEAWLDPAISDDEVLAGVRSLRGFGPYAAEGMLGLLGRPRGLALDSWVRAQLPVIAGVNGMTDKQITARYAPYGRWAGTALWLELTRDWFGD